MEFINPELSGSINITGSLNITASIEALRSDGEIGLSYEYDTGTLQASGSISGSFEGRLVDNTANYLIWVPQASAPGSPEDGMMYADENYNLRIYSASAWHNINLV